MNKTNQFSAKATYVSPFCKAVELQLNAILCQSGDYDSVWHTERYGVDQDEDL